MKPCSLLWMCHFLDFLLRWSFFANLSRNWWKMKKSKLWEKYCTKWLQIFTQRAGKWIDQIEIKKCAFLHFLQFLLKKRKKASGIKLAGIFVPRPNFVAANLREIKNPEDWRNKIQNFKLKIFLKIFFENLVRGHRSIFLIIDFFEP